MLFEIAPVTCGHAAILRDSFYALIQKARKTRPSVKQRRAAGYSKHYDSLFTTVKLNFSERGLLSVEQFVIDGFDGEDYAIESWICQAAIAGIRLASYEFQVLLNVEVLHDILKLLDSQRLDLEWHPDRGRFIMKNDNNRTSLIAVRREDIRLPA